VEKLAARGASADARLAGAADAAPKARAPGRHVSSILAVALLLLLRGKKRTQRLEGTIIAEAGTGNGKSVTLRRIFQGVGIELKCPLHAPAVQSIEIVKRGRVRRAKLYYLRDRQGKAARLKEVVGAKGKPTAAMAAAAAAAAAAPAAAQ